MTRNTEPGSPDGHCPQTNGNGQAPITNGRSSTAVDEEGSVEESLKELVYDRRCGKCKWFNVAKGWGFITPTDGGPDVFVHQSVIQMPGFRSLGDEEEVEFECKASDKGFEATLVTGPQNQDCKGSHRRPLSKKRFRKIRCYNCGEFANHIAAKCTMGPQPKRCHHCKSADHLIADCPQREEKKSPRNGDGTNGITSEGGDTASHQDNNNNTSSQRSSSPSNGDFEEEEDGDLTVTQNGKDK